MVVTITCTQGNTKDNPITPKKTRSGDHEQWSECSGSPKVGLYVPSPLIPSSKKAHHKLWLVALRSRSYRPLVLPAYGRRLQVLCWRED